jgi:hypothetical protein
MRQIPLEEVSDSSVSNSRVLEMMITITFFCALPFLAAGTMISLWLTLNSLQLISHLVLLNIEMPAKTADMLVGVLSFLRLDFIGINSESELLIQEEIDASKFNLIRHQAGYTNSYAQNLVCITLGLLLVYSLLMIIQTNRCCKQVDYQGR